MINCLYDNTYLYLELYFHRKQYHMGALCYTLIKAWRGSILYNEPFTHAHTQKYHSGIWCYTQKIKDWVLCFIGKPQEGFAYFFTQKKNLSIQSKSSKFLG